MSAISKIEWTEATWNPIRGCSRISPGCQKCYAERIAARNLPAQRSPTTGQPFAIMLPDGPHWTGKVELIESMLDTPLRRRKPTMYFVNSMSDLFHESLPDEAIDEVMARIILSDSHRATPRNHTMQVLTKRADRALRYMSNPLTPYRVSAIVCGIVVGFRPREGSLDWTPITPWPPDNLWLGVSVEDRVRRGRIDHLRQTPATVRFLSVEPLLEDVGTLNLDGIHWVIVGGESGPGARPMNPDWARSIRGQCVAAGVPFFFKQMTEKGRKIPFSMFPADLQIREMPNA